MELFSTQASIEARANIYRLRLWADKNKDTIPDPATLAQAFEFAASTILGYLVRRYGETEVNSWTLADCPAKVLRWSDDLAIWYLSGGNNSQNALIQLGYETVIAELADVRDDVINVYDAVDGVTDRFVTEVMDNPFEDLLYYNV